MSGYGMGVFDQHQAKLKSSAITPAVARERGYVTADQKTQLERYGFSSAQRRVPALVIPLHDVFGEIAGYQIRPDQPRVLSGRTMKYESRLGQKMILDVPPRVHPHLGDPTRPLVATEGPLKADALVSAGLDTVALLGVWGWRGTNDDGGKVALAAWEQVALNHRQLYLAFDSDVMLKPQVYEAMSRFGAWLKLKGAQVAYVYLPSNAGQKVGADDFLAAGNTATDLIALATSELRKPPAAPTAPEPVDTFDDVPDEPGYRVLDDVVAVLDRYVAWPSDHHRDAVVLWIAHTWLYDCFDITPRLAVLSPQKQCGKTRLMELVKFLSRRARFTLTMSAAYMFRIIEESAPTLLVDEADTVFGSRQKNDNHEDLRGLLNGGWERGAVVGKMVGDGAGMVPKDFATFAPVALAGIGNFLPDTVLDRSIIIRMRRRAPDEAVEPMRQRRAIARTAPLNRRLAAWAHRVADRLDDVDPDMPEGIVDRAADVWAPLVAVADEAGGDWPTRARKACVALIAARAEDDPGTSEKLLADIREAFEWAAATNRPVTDRVHSADLVEWLNALDERPWAGWNKNNGIRPVDLAGQLGGYGIKSKNVRIGETQKKGYELEQFADAFTRYLPPGMSVPTSQNEDRPKETHSDQGQYSGTAGTAYRDGADRDGNGDRPSPQDRTVDKLLEETFGPDVIDDDQDYARRLNPGEIGPIDRSELW
jgi:hypothetical protein